MPNRKPTTKQTKRKIVHTRPRPNYELLDQRRAVREQRELVKLTRKLRRDQATHRRELRMLWMDLTRMFTGKFPDELAALSGEPNIASTEADERLEPVAAGDTF
jgi:hypothetical protein